MITLYEYTLTYLTVPYWTFKNCFQILDIKNDLISSNVKHIYFPQDET